MDIAIHYEKYNLDDEKCIFRPVDVVRGKYNKDSNIFVTESGIVCYHIKSREINENDYFSSPTNFEELKKLYISELKNIYGETLDAIGGLNVKDEDILYNFLSRCMENCYIGLYDYGEPTKVIQIPIYAITDKDFCEYVSYDGKEFSFNSKYLNQLKESKTVEEFKEKLDKLIELKEEAEKDFESQDEQIDNTEEETKDIVEEEPKYKVNRPESINFKEIRSNILKNVVAQDDAVNKVLTRVGMNYISKNFRNKGHILIAGPTGTGKTEIGTMISKELGLVYHCVNATDYTQEGYVGDSVSDMLAGLIYAADFDIEAAENGILFIDEIDKKAATNSQSEVSNKAVQDSLLKITGRGIVQVNIVEKGRRKTIDFDTSNLTVFFMGAFEGLEEIAKKQSKSNIIGFGIENSKKDEEIKILPEHFNTYGMTPELMGRIKCIAFTNKFKVEDYIKIAYKSNISPLKIKEELYKDLGTDLRYSKGYVEQIAKIAEKINKGARGLDIAISESLSVFENDFLFNDVRPKVLKLTKRTALNPKDYSVE